VPGRWAKQNDEVTMKNAIITLSVLIFSVTLSYAKELYRAPSAGDQGSYYIIESKKLDNGNIPSIKQSHR
jgi:hypothetical protein